MPNLFESAERLYKRIAGSSQKPSGGGGGGNASSRGGKYNRSKLDSRSNDSTPVSSDASPLRWSTQKNYSARAASSSNLNEAATAFGMDQDEGTSPSPLQSPRAAHPPGDLTAVSSEGDDESDSDSIQGAGQGQPAHARTQRLRQSMQRAKAAQFETTDNPNRYPSAERLIAQTGGYFEEQRDDDGDNDDNDDAEAEAKVTIELQTLEKGGIDSDEEERGDEDNEQDEREGMTDNMARSYMVSQALQSRVGVHWPSYPPQPLVELLPKIRRCLGPQTTEFVRAICQRPSCRCHLRGHDTLMLFPIFDAVMCEATWEKIKEGHGSSRTGSHLLSRLQHGRLPGPSSETQAKLILFRQCRGWYEVINENFEPVPHWTTIDEVRRAKPMTFLVRRDLKCLLAPSSLWVPTFLNSSEQDPTAPPVPVSSAIISEARDPGCIAKGSPFVLKPGTLLSYVDCLHGCTVSRGKKLKQLSLVLAVEKTRSTRPNDLATPRRLFYIGTEDASNQAIFPTKVALSPIAGPDNISGVHVLTSLLRKFRLPLSVVPVAVPEYKSANGLGGSNWSSLSGNSDTVDYATAQSSKPVNIFPSVPGITFTDRTFIRLRELLRGDILIMAPVDAPDRLFLITPTLLQDHLFQIGFTEDTIYHRLAMGHRNRTLRFLTMAHPRDSLSYLLDYLKHITNKPRLMTPTESETSVAGELTNRLIAGVMQHHEITSAMAKTIFSETGKDPRTGPACELTPEQLDQAYDDMDDLYFFTRNGYFPAKSRQRLAKFNTTAAATLGQPQTQAHRLGSLAPTPNTRAQIPSAEQLLAQTLHISTTYK